MLEDDKNRTGGQRFRYDAQHRVEERRTSEKYEKENTYITKNCLEPSLKKESKRVTTKVVTMDKGKS